MTQKDQDDAIISLADIASETKSNVLRHRERKKRWGNEIQRRHRRNRIARLSRRANR